MSSVPPSTIHCLLCGGSFLFPGPRYAAHLLHEHGVIYDSDFLIAVSQHKKSYSSLPIIPKLLAESSSQTSHSTGAGDRLCSSCSPSHQVTGCGGRREAQDSINDFWKNEIEEGVKEENATNEVNWDTPENVIVKPDIDADFGASYVNDSLKASKHAEALASDMQCYFNCGEVFKKGYDLQVHIKLRHKDEDPMELAHAEEAAKFEIALTKRSGCVYKCALCEKIVEGWSVFWEHIRKHKVSCAEYKAKYGKCEIETASFQCRICQKVIKHETNIIHKHLQHTHGINWTQYLARVRQELGGIKQEPLPEIISEKCKICNLRVKYMKLHMRNKHGFSKKVRCQVCDVSVKYLKTHLKKTHGITSDEYEQLTSEASGDLPLLDCSQNAKYVKCPPSDSDASLTGYSDASFMSNTSRISMENTLPKPSKAEMSDKTVKHCSVCDIQFDTRKSFIDHCQVVHSVRFKTKSLGLWKMFPSCPEVDQSTTNHVRAVQSNSNQFRLVQSTTNQLSAIQSTTNQLSAVQSTTNQLSAVQSTSNQLRAVQSTTNQLRTVQATSNRVRAVQLNFSGSVECQPPPTKVPKIVWPQKQGSLVCKDCGDKFKTWRYLDQHMKLNCNQHMKLNCKRVACESCGKTYSSLLNLKKHRKTSCQTQGSLSLSPSIIARDIVEQVISRVFSVSQGPRVDFKCPVEDCGQQFGRSVHLRRHLANYHDQ